nr:CHAT domain-containing protein [Paraburkholderia caribensis]
MGGANFEASVIDLSFQRHDGKALAAVARDGTVVVWPSKDARDYHQWRLEGTECCEFAPDGSLVTGGRDGLVCLWNGNGCIARNEFGEGNVVDISFFGSPTKMAVATSEGTIGIVDPANLHPLDAVRFGPYASVYRCRAIDNASFFIASVQFTHGVSMTLDKSRVPDQYEIAIWDESRGEMPFGQSNLVGHYGWIGALAVAPDASVFLSGATDHAIRLWNPWQSQCLATVREHEGAIYDALFLRDCTRFVTCSADGTVRLWQTGDVRRAGAPVTTLDDVRRAFARALEEPPRHGMNWLSVAGQNVIEYCLGQHSAHAVDQCVHVLEKALGDCTFDDFNAFGQLITNIFRVRKEQANREGDRRNAAMCEQFGQRFVEQAFSRIFPHVHRAVADEQAPDKGDNNDNGSDSKADAAIAAIFKSVLSGSMSAQAAETELKAIAPDTRVLTDVIYRTEELTQPMWEVADSTMQLGEVIDRIALRRNDPTLSCISATILASLCGVARQTNRGIDLLEREARRDQSQVPRARRIQMRICLGNHYRNAGRPHDALQAFSDATALLKTAREPSPDVDISPKLHDSLSISLLTNEAVVHSDLGEFGLKISMLEEAESIARMQGDQRTMILLLCNLAEAFTEVGNHEGALLRMDEAIAIDGALGGSRSDALQARRAVIAARANDKLTSDAAQVLLTYARRSGEVETECEALRRLARALLNEGDLEEAEATARRACAKAMTCDRTIQAYSEQLLGEVLIERVPEEGYRTLESALRIWEALRADVNSLERGARLHGRIALVCAKLIRLALSLNRPDDVWMFAERARAGTFMRVSRSGAAEAMDYAPMSLHETRQHLKALNKRALLVSFFMYDESVYIIAVQPDGPLQVTKQALPSSSLDQCLTALKKEVMEYQRYQDSTETWTDVSDVLITPIVPLLDNVELIIFAPYDDLHLLPLHALKMDGDYLIERFAVTYVPSGSSLRTLAQPAVKAPEAFLSIGVDFVSEAELVASMVGAKMRMMSPAIDKPTLKQAFARADAIHVSAHGVASSTRPSLNGFVLADLSGVTQFFATLDKPPQERLYPEDECILGNADAVAENVFSAEDVERLERLNARLITLSACQSGAIAKTVSREPVGFVRALLDAGVQTVIAASWRLDAESAELLMQSLYRILQEENRWDDIPEALRLAVRQVAATHPHPYHWAAFKVTGGLVLKGEC